MELDADKVFTCSEERDKKHDMMLDLSLSGQKSENLFAGSDQTPTPTRLIRNCEEVGLFDDLRHVNPFEETFRLAVEQNTGDTPIRQLDSVEASHIDEDSLHTPQVYPQLEHIHSCEMLAKPLDSPSSAAVTLDVPVVDELLNAAADAYKIGTSRQNSNTSTTSSSGYGKIHKYRTSTSVEKPAAATTSTELPSDGRLPYMHLPGTTIQLIQPQVITLSFPDSTITNKSNTNDSGNKQMSAAANAIPIQTVKPFIMPKLAPSPASAPPATSVSSSSTTKHVTAATTQLLADVVTSTTSAATQPQLQSMLHEPSSASLTPTSQLPIKERLKAILSHGHKTQQAASAQLTKPTNRRMRNAVPTGKYDEDSMVRRRAAATRYRNKMRNEHKELRRRNVELQSENEKLRMQVKQLEQELSKLQQQTTSAGTVVQSVPAQLQIPPSTLHLVMNIPTMLMPAGGQPTLMQPITYRVEKK